MSKTVLSVNPWVIHRDRSIFGEDADSFNPERWLDPQRAKSMDKYLIHVRVQAFSYILFP